jgi:hypothetical protein
LQLQAIRHGSPIEPIEQANGNCRNRQVTIAIVLVLLVIGNIVLSIVAVRRNLPRGSFIVCDGVRLHYIDRGDPAAPCAAVRRELVAVAALRSGDWPGLPESFDTEDQNSILRARIDHDAEIARRSVQARATEPSA